MPLDPNDPEDFVDVTLKTSLRTSLIRTFTPILVGFASLALLRLGFHIDDATLASSISSAISFLYYALIRKLETLHPAIGRFLGSATPPVYDTVDGQLQARLDQLAHMIRQDSINRRALLLPDAFKEGTSYPDAAPMYQPPPRPGVPGPLHDPLNKDI